MNYTPLTEENIEKVATLYMNHYNQHSGGCGSLWENKT